MIDFHVHMGRIYRHDYPWAMNLTVEQLIDSWVKRFGVSGSGEHINELPFDDPRNKLIYAKCNDHGLPLVFEINSDLCNDDPGLPRLEACLKQFPRVKFVGHGPAFWSAMFERSAVDLRRPSIHAGSRRRCSCGTPR